MIKKNNTSTKKRNVFSLDSKLDTPEKIHHYYQKIIGSLPNNVYWLDRNCITQGCNSNILKLVGLKTFEEFIGMDYKKMGQLAGWTEGQAESFERDDREVMETGVPKLNVEEPPLYDAEGNPIYYMSSRKPIFDDKGQEVIGVVGISVDITEKKKAAQALILAKEKAEVANQAKTEFLENMRHDIRTPLSGIVGCAHLIQRQSDKSKKVKEFASGLVESSDALLEFLNKILESITVASGEIPLLKRRFKLKEALEEIVHLNRSAAVIKELALSLVYDETIPSYLIGDDIRMQRIILELLTNALKYTDKGEIRVSARLMKSEEHKVVVELRVSDTGVGIPKDKHNEVYTRFTRLTPSYKGIYSGTGLGLSIVKEFIEDLRGEIHIESDVGKGATFICVIPFQKSLLGESEIEEAKEIKGKAVKENVVSLHKEKINESLISEEIVIDGSRVLIVEDSPMAVMVTRNVLSELGCQTDVAGDGKTALEKIGKNHYDLILMDVGLPDYDGCEVTRRIRLKQWQKKSPVPIIGLTAHIEAEKKQSCIANGMNVIYNKPLTSEKAIEILNSFVSHQHQSQKDIHNIPAAPIQSIVPILDIQRAVEIIGKKEVVKECLDLLVNNLYKELEVIKQQYKENDWLGIKNMAHKWKGGASYCGANRLEQVCEQLAAALRTELPEEEAEMRYQQLIQVAEETKEAVKKAIKEIS